MFKKLFTYLDDFRPLPNYQLERRTDIFFAIYLKELMEKRTSGKISDVIIPEFPLWRGIVHEGYKPLLSYKIDYVLFGEDFTKMYFVELKTDSLSRRVSQDEYLLKAKEVGFGVMLEGLINIFNATTSKRKYYHLFEKICKTGLAEMPGDLKGCIFSDTQVSKKISEMIKDIKINQKQPNVEIFYIQPKGDTEEVINFDYIADFLRDYDDDFSKLFRKHLIKWTNQI